MYGIQLNNEIVLLCQNIFLPAPEKEHLNMTNLKGNKAVPISVGTVRGKKHFNILNQKEHELGNCENWSLAMQYLNLLKRTGDVLSSEPQTLRRSLTLFSEYLDIIVYHIKMDIHIHVVYVLHII
jgi:hypothetical protein